MTDQEMLEESARVIGVVGDKIWIETESRSGCSQCASSNCTTSVVAKLFGVQKNKLLIDNGLEAKPGDQVVIGVPGRLIAKASVLAYLLPLVLMLAITLMGSALGINDGMQSLLALAGLSIGLLLVRWITNRGVSTPGYGPQLLKVVGNSYKHVVFPKHMRS
ncbi:MAG: SoxR reducing system RseC family protein [Candidatus Thiodiazotropha lotti]|uniref:SoxR reducing system RseC family protein n=1 Tax=Candidatus Thiodiazotropha lotti TaxID=2792787 RepID=A0A9E4K138_9GAMM|nr:SoxR reducing system RseC family protein [Candidatus Thiodiazotropha lotti]MCG7937417.1 SoxR reducing system RseC family protein [Candidatus Thiodiazotropha lotti]MCG7986287.1 SoxR reducing system RseC family protein [Candidatus Thiodiazotropha lotti]MCG8010557.1 SoxR reducing system RseC family protein [Candidatus Thiodiazotropha lotti]MCW4201883.1 SoxR reducing system RseC family protein [Candidatus Thiodiazotropha lotti]